MKKLTYCNICVLPSTKPHIKFDKNGTVTACLFHMKKIQILKIKLIGKKKVNLIN